MSICIEVLNAETLHIVHNNTLDFTTFTMTVVTGVWLDTLLALLLRFMEVEIHCLDLDL